MAVRFLDIVVYSVGGLTFAEGQGLGGSTLLQKVNAGDFEGAAKEFLKWNKAGGQVFGRFNPTRKAESLLFQNIVDDNCDGVADKPKRSCSRCRKPSTTQRIEHAS